MNKYSSSILLFIILSFFSVAFSASAQLRETDVSISLIPSYPNPNQSVEAIIKSQSINLDKSFMTWSLNGQEQLKGIGKKEFKFNIGSLGSSINVSVLIDTATSGNITKTITIKPASVDLLWEAIDSYVPPFYKGKALGISQGAIKVAAIPSFASQSGSKNLTYMWNKDGKTELQFSGWGKNFMTFTNSYLDTENEIFVKASDLLGSATATNSIKLTTKNPKILFYKIDPLLGTLWNKTIQNGFFIEKGGETFIAEPYFISFKNINSSNIVFDWFLNNKKIVPPELKNVLSVAIGSEEHGNSIIKTKIKNTDTLFQEAEKELKVSF